MNYTIVDHGTNMLHENTNVTCTLLISYLILMMMMMKEAREMEKQWTYNDNNESSDPILDMSQTCTS